MSSGEGRGATFSIHSGERPHPKGPRSGAAEFKRLDLSGIKILVVETDRTL
jgi:hypothetical protein